MQPTVRNVPVNNIVSIHLHGDDIHKKVQVMFRRRLFELYTHFNALPSMYEGYQQVLEITQK